MPARPNELRSRKTFGSVEHGCPRVSASMGRFAPHFARARAKGKRSFRTDRQRPASFRAFGRSISKLQLICPIYTDWSDPLDPRQSMRSGFHFPAKCEFMIRSLIISQLQSESDSNETSHSNSLRPTIPVYCTCALRQEFIERVSRFCGSAGYMGCHGMACCFFSVCFFPFALPH